MKKVFLFSLLAFPLLALAQTPEEDIGFILKQALDAVSNWQAVGWQAGLAGFITLLISTTKNTLIRKYTWDKIPKNFRVFVPPLLAILLFALQMGKGFSMQAFVAGITTGAASVYLHELLSAVGGLFDRKKDDHTTNLPS